MSSPSYIRIRNSRGVPGDGAKQSIQFYFSSSLCQTLSLCCCFLLLFCLCVWEEIYFLELILEQGGYLWEKKTRTEAVHGKYMKSSVRKVSVCDVWTKTAPSFPPSQPRWRFLMTAAAKNIGPLLAPAPTRVFFPAWEGYECFSSRPELLAAKAKRQGIANERWDTCHTAPTYGMETTLGGKHWKYWDPDCICHSSRECGFLSGETSWEELGCCPLYWVFSF